jgi:hypothetical protein
VYPQPQGIETYAEHAGKTHPHLFQQGFFRIIDPNVTIMFFCGHM